MIIHEKSKVAILLNPKTGSTTLCDIFQKYDVDVCIHDHKTLTDFREEYSDHSEYKIYSFYREPIERFKSAYNTALSLHNHRTFRFILLKNVSKKSISMYDVAKPISEENIEYLKNISPYEMLTALNTEDINKIRSFTPLFANQIQWIDDSVTTLNFENFESEVKMLIETCGFDSSKL